MATIKPFRAIRPAHAELTGQLKDLLEAGARARPETPEGQIAAYSDIQETLRELLKSGQLLKEETPAIYIYEMEHPAYRQTGIWALTALEDYRSGRIKRHELTLKDSVRRLKNYRAHTRLEGSPVLLTYVPDAEIDQMISTFKCEPAFSSLIDEQGNHRLWRVEDCQPLIDAFARLGPVYVADGHHRLESAAELSGDIKSFGKPVYDSLSTLYMSATELRSRDYHRAVILAAPVDTARLLQQLSWNFAIRSTKELVRPTKKHQFGMLIGGACYELTAKEGGVDAAILQDRVLWPFFGISDPKADPRLKCIGGGQAMTALLAFIAEHPCSVAFTLYPMAVTELLAVARAGEILPPKSTWIDPKVPYGLILYQHEPLAYEAY
ncbi:MAG: hypothetical protein JWQ34_2644 [Mucilaginibacter sp.]|uniref:DUF1015 family protein n=1 Tax=Mucilaginibacter sp. TaxID=1882438 RepID=UPI0026386213|nr:DUF1015 family protein [Mucilaginibacter sp.]MDB5004419.1 hypothetical protein [Mucilaginibacter sp.]